MHERKRKPLDELLYCDEALFAVPKPAGVFSTGGGEEVGVADLYAGQFGLPADEPFLTTERLDEAASGVVLYARTPEDRKALLAQFDEGRAETVYHVLVTGHVEEDGEIDVPLYYDKRRGRWVTSTEKGKPARTRYTVLQRIAGNSLLACRADRQRTDQIRVHLTAIGHPLTVDPKLGGGTAVYLSHLKPGYRKNARRPEQPLIDRLTIHAAEVHFAHPRTGAPMQIICPPPKDFRAAVHQLSRLV